MPYTPRGSIIPVLAAALLASANGTAQESGKSAEKQLRIVRTDTAPVIDGRLDDAVWATASTIDDFVTAEPNEGDEPSEYTQVYVLYDRDALYIAARAWHSSLDLLVDRVLRQGERLFGEDSIAIVLDPFNNQRSGYLFVVNANGVREDALYENTTNLEFNWE